MENESSAFGTEDSPFFVRKPIFDRDKNVWAIELLANDSPDAAVGAGDPLQLTSFLSDKNLLDQYGAPASRILYPLQDSPFSTSIAHPLDQVVIDTQYGVNSPSFLDTLAGMREQGATVLLDESVELELFEFLLPHADILRISLTSRSPRDVIKLCAKFKSFQGDLMASGVAGWDAYEGTKALGFTLFQGPFYSQLQQTASDGPAPSAIAKLQLLRELSNVEIDMEQLSEVIASDISLSYRLLRYINSAAFGMPSKIKSVQQAVTLLGLKEVRHWATVVAMTDLDASPKGEELAFLALQRARFLGKMAENITGLAHSVESMFLLGLFSKLDALLSYAMKKALKDIPLDQEMKDALCGERNSMRDWLDMLIAVEETRWQDANLILEKYGACFTQAATLYLRASSWAARQLPSMKK